MISQGVNDGLPSGSRFRLAAVSSCALVFVAFIVFWHVPFRVEADIAYVAKAAQQYVNHGVPFNQLRLVDPRDLSRDVDTWIFWWPPFICAAFATLQSLGLTIGFSAWLLMVTAAVVGALGWAKVSAGLFSSRFALVLSAVPTLLYIVNNEMFDQFSSGDPIVFAVMPWLFVLALRLHDNPHPGQISERQLFALGTACGALYWIKFSALLGAVPLMISVGLVIIQADRSLRRAIKLGMTALGFLIPVASLWLLNRSRGGDFLQSSIAVAGQFQNLPDAAMHAAAMVVLPIEKGVNRLLTGYDLPLIVRGTAVVLAVIVVVEAWRGWGRGVGVLAALLVVTPIGALAYLTWASGFQFLLDIGRHAAPYWIFLQLVLVGVLVGDVGRRSGRDDWIRKAAIGCVAVLLVFAAYAPYVALRDSLSHQKSDRDERTGLQYPVLSTSRSGALVQSIRAHLSANDVVVPASYWQGMDSWLAFDQRLLPLTNFYQPLAATHGREGADYSAVSPLRSTRPLRVVLILADPYDEPRIREWNERIKGRFDQAGEWSELQQPENTNTTVWSATLSPGPAAGELRSGSGAH